MKKKKWTILMCAVLFSAIVTGCSDTVSKVSSETKKDKKVTLKFYSHGTEASYNWRKTINAFEKKYPNIHVDLIVLSEKGDTQEATKKLDLAAASGDPMDVLMFSESASYAQRVSMGMAAPLDKFIKKDGYKVSEEYKVDTQINGKHYALPGKFNPWYVLLNKDHLDAAGLKVPKDWTWDEFMEYAKALTRDGHYGTYFHGPQDGSWMEYMRLALASEPENTEFITGKGKSNLENPLFKKSLEIRLKMEKNDKSAVPYADVLSKKLHYRNEFYNQDVSSIIIGSWMNTELGGSEQLPLNFHLAVAPYPKNNKNEKSGYAPVTTDYMAIAASSKHKKEAYTFIRWYTTEGQIVQGKNIPAWNKVSDTDLKKIINHILNSAQDPERVDKESLINVLTNAKSSKLISPVPNQAEIYKVINEEYEKLIFGQQNIDKTIQVTNERVQDILNNK
ncbi:ABC transporter substrate-binding protein [Neobacillus cucumis]|uniref:ABC transporter substrate-binding protein n=1 Tax=Neobacillus cucumis TaxID=1740721 RepID=A0A2N5HJA2_9BACI|nr:extracellular solute-binding protein [Neobacillus cucumis]PLS05600.1 ABC transporter substrate-binding protein [Neobacillus cucumis]